MIRGLVDAIRGTLAGKLALLQQNFHVEYAWRSGGLASDADAD